MHTGNANHAPKMRRSLNASPARLRFLHEAGAVKSAGHYALQTQTGTLTRADATSLALNLGADCVTS